MFSGVMPKHPSGRPTVSARRVAAVVYSAHCGSGCQLSFVFQLAVPLFATALALFLGLINVLAVALLLHLFLRSWS
jgi:hypothetical protein